MKTYFDSSAFAKRYLEEEGSAEVDAICRDTSELALSILSPPEIVSALSRRHREGNLTKKEFRTAKKALFVDVEDATVINLDRGIVEDAIVLLEKFPIRTLDALHIASAKAWQSECFVSADQRQTQTAKKMGLSCVLV